MEKRLGEYIAEIIDLLTDDTHHCRCCGRCCETFGGHLHAWESDLARWRSEGRDDLLAMVNDLGWIWCDPATGEKLERCPFLQRDGELWICTIHETRPQICRDYPPMEHWGRCIRRSRIPD